MNNVLPALKDIIEAVVEAAEADTLEDVLEQINLVAKDIVNARYAALGVPDGKGGLRFFKTAGLTPEQADAIPHEPEGRGLLGAIMRDREIIRLDHMSSDARSAGFPDNHPKMDSLLGVPIQVGQQLYGMLYLSDRVDGLPFDEQDEWLVETLAGYAALAIAGVQLSDQKNRVTLLEERERVAMELHDGTIQSLYAVGMKLQLMRLSGEMSLDALGESINDLDMVIEDIRGYILNLKTSNYRMQTIREALEDIVVRLSARESMDVDVSAPDERPFFSAPVFEAVCQIARESLSNVLRHAEAKSVSVTAKQRNDQFVLTIKDDGVGFDMHNPDRHYSGMGLRNIRQRARICDAELEITSVVDEGTQVKITLPLQYD